MNWEIVAGVFVAALAGGFFPAVCSEFLVVGAVVADPADIVAIVIAASSGQMIAKTSYYALARWAPHYLPARARSALGRAQGAVASRGRAAGSLVLMSAGVGLPPFFLVSLACGALGVGLVTFAVTGTAGRTVRYVVLAGLARAGSLAVGG